MSRENVEAVRAIYERWSQGDFRPGDALDPLILFVLRPEFPDAGTYLGLERLTESSFGFVCRQEPGYSPGAIRKPGSRCSVARIAACHFPGRSSKLSASRSASWNSRRWSSLISLSGG
jgi:hypothetical protein